MKYLAIQRLLHMIKIAHFNLSNAKLIPIVRPNASGKKLNSMKPSAPTSPCLAFTADLWSKE